MAGILTENNHQVTKEMVSGLPDIIKKPIVKMADVTGITKALDASVMLVPNGDCLSTKVHDCYKCELVLCVRCHV